MSTTLPRQNCFKTQGLLPGSSLSQWAMSLLYIVSKWVSLSDPPSLFVPSRTQYEGPRCSFTSLMNPSDQNLCISSAASEPVKYVHSEINWSSFMMKWDADIRWRMRDCSQWYVNFPMCALIRQERVKTELLIQNILYFFHNKTSETWQQKKRNMKLINTPNPGHLAIKYV